MGNEVKYKVLLVEDEPNVALLFKYNLTKAGFMLDVATNGKEGLEKVKSFNPDLILSDIMMPVMDGYEFRKNLLKDEILSGIPFVFLTAKGSEDDIVEGYELDIEDYILKTSSPKIVIKKIESILKSKKKERDKVVGELNKAADNMGARVVPDDFPVIPGYDVRHWHKPFENIPGGDFIDYVPVTEDKTVIVLGDVMGKRWNAWYFAYAYSGYVRSAVRVALQSSENYSASTIMTKVNEAVFEDDRISEVFTTLSIVVLDYAKNKLTYTGAGDLPLFLKKKGEHAKTVKSNGLLLGFAKTSEFEDVEVELNSGDFILLTTDGITESKDKNQIMFTEKGLLAAIDSMPEGEDPISFVKNCISIYTGNKFEDDMSLILIKKV